MARKYNKYGRAFKLKVAVEALKERKTAAELCHEFGVSLSQISTWKKQLLKEGDKSFGETSDKKQKKEIDRLHKIIGKIKAENDFLESVLKD